MNLWFIQSAAAAVRPSGKSDDASFGPRLSPSLPLSFFFGLFPRRNNQLHQLSMCPISHSYFMQAAAAWPGLTSAAVYSFSPVTCCLGGRQLAPAVARHLISLGTITIQPPTLLLLLLLESPPFRALMKYKTTQRPPHLLVDVRNSNSVWLTNSRSPLNPHRFVSFTFITVWTTNADGRTVWKTSWILNHWTLYSLLATFNYR